MATVERPHFAQPFVRGTNGKVKVVEQDDPAHIEGCVLAIVQCPVNFRQERPEFGWPWPVFRSANARGLDLTDLKAAIQEFEPRADLRILETSVPVYSQIQRIGALLASPDTLAGPLLPASAGKVQSVELLDPGAARMDILLSRAAGE